MKKVFKIAGIILIVALYSFTMGMGGNNSFDSSLKGAGKTREENKSYFKAVSVNLFYFTPKSESSLNTFHNTTPSTFKTSFKEFAVVVKTTEQFFDSKFVQYNFSLKNCLFRYRKSDIIFPFHYFW